MSEEVCLNPSLLCNPTHRVFMGNSLAKTQKFSLFSPRLLNLHLVTARASTVSSARGPVQHDDHSKHVLPSHAKKALVAKRCTSTRRHDSCSSGLLEPVSVITTAMENIQTSGVGTAGQAANPVLPTPRFLAQGGKQYGSGVVNYINRALAGRSAHLGLSFLWLWPHGHCRGAADCHHRAAPHWPNMKGAAIQSRGAPCHSTPTCTAHLRYSPACSPWC
jgi:hypothetical protein